MSSIIESLPIELTAYHIFPYLSIGDLCSTSLVCKYWRNVSSLVLTYSHPLIEQLQITPGLSILSLVAWESWIDSLKAEDLNSWFLSLQQAFPQGAPSEVVSFVQRLLISLSARAHYTLPECVQQQFCVGFMRLVSMEQSRVTTIPESKPNQVGYIVSEKEHSNSQAELTRIENRKQRFEWLCQTVAAFPGFLLSHTEFFFAFLTNLFATYMEFPDVVENCIFTMIFALGCAAHHPLAKAIMNKVMDILSNVDPVWLSLRVRYKMFQLFEGFWSPGQYSNVLADLLVFKSLLKSKQRAGGPWEPGVPKLTNEVGTFLDGFELALRQSIIQANRCV
ncbi:hypothetical protein K493DRAFT_308243 [Basidiobolus meristosporus CBS 931.73]|uniref:F-box domain-containing protein n=1 Tax=Basidiobolus meristosporus CBS 931.73 TaxID=1314790 RepID=A0A1Y1X588_9FUNG|nr:hypothetical protein K493DRAFT_308243 [Basidiobolus meristosporus CBS 931.73]|eukprot:ORX80818.1 hypothetical protein K493DRAFT_308243 [Basidiobolus meristosporus CBS 931.73]